MHGTMAVVRVVAQMVQGNLHQPLGQRPPHDPVLEEAGEKPRKDGDDLKLHTSMIDAAHRTCSENSRRARSEIPRWIATPRTLNTAHSSQICSNVAQPSWPTSNRC